MRLLFVDIDTLRPDHLGCYGYGRNTTPCIDSIAEEGVVFENYYTPNAPCLPSRACLQTGMNGIHNGAVGHGGTAGDLFLTGEPRGFQDQIAQNNLVNVFRKAGMRTASVSTFAERHSAWWFYAGFNEIFNVGGCGHESAEEVTPVALKWLEENAQSDDWMLHYHLWDAHSPYRAPAEFGNPFKADPLPDDWIDDEIFATHRRHVGPHGLREIRMWSSKYDPKYPRHPGEIKTLAEAHEFLDNYDCGVRYADENLAMLIKVLKNRGVYEDTAIIVTSDHGENLGELGLYAEHATADEPCCHIPMIIKWPGVLPGRRNAFHLNIDLVPTMAELLGVEPYSLWDGESYASALTDEVDSGYESLVISQHAHTLQRSARFDDYIYIRSVHGGYHLFPEEMLFNIKDDKHEQHNLAAQRPDLCAKGAKIILDWEYAMMKTSRFAVDPMWTVLREGGPYHSRGRLHKYAERLRNMERGEYVEELLAMYPNEKYN